MTSHGTTACYYAGCRRDECRKAKAERVAANRAAARARGFVGLNHGLRATYDAGCRCEPCRALGRKVRSAYRPRRSPAALTHGTCGACGFRFGLLKGGYLRIHGPIGAECPGSHYIAAELLKRPTGKAAA